jgi:hypothetical protein
LLRPAVGAASLLALTLGVGLCIIWSSPREPTNEPSERASPQVRSPFNGFDLTRATVPVSMILSGGPDRDGIPAIDRPRFVTPETADYLRTDDVVISLTLDGVTRAYPLRILVWHEIVNDVLGKHPVAVTYCPLCGTAMVFRRELKGRTLSFGVSGLLYQSDVLLYDRETESLWSQLAMSAVSGEYGGTPMEWLVSQQLTWSEWKRQFPEGWVLSTRTGAHRDYSVAPYRDYEASPEPLFPIAVQRRELASKDWIVGVILDGVARAYPLKSLAAGRTFQDQSKALELIWAGDSQRIEVRQMATGQPIPSVLAYWFAWQAFYPNTEIWNP